MAVEQYTESLTLKEMKCVIGKNHFGYVFPQGDVSNIEKIELLLRQAGGKPKECEIDDFSMGGKGKAKPEYIITFNDNIHEIIVVECKNSVKKHCSPDKNRPSDYAVDGVLYYAKFLKQEYNVIAIAVSGTQINNMKVDTFYWMKGQSTFSMLEKAKDIILEPFNYIELIKGSRLRKAYSLDEIRNIAIDMHNSLREIKVTEAHAPHDSTQETFFGYCKEDGFIKKKKVGRIDAFGRWSEIEKEWLDLYRNKDVVDGLSARHCVSYKDEWLCEAYMKTDYSKLTPKHFQKTVNDYLAYLIKYGDKVENSLGGENEA